MQYNLEDSNANKMYDNIHTILNQVFFLHSQIKFIIYVLLN
jgi:hypothetical protein